MKGGIKLEAFRREMEQMYQVFDQGSSAVKAVLSKLDDSFEDLREVQEQVAAANRETAEDEIVREGLQRNIRNLVKHRNDVLQLLRQGEEKIRDQTEQAEELQQIVDAGPGWSPEQKHKQQMLARDRENAQRKSEDTANQLSNLRREMTAMTTAIGEFQKRSDDISRRAEKARGQWERDEGLAAFQRRRKAKLERKLQSLQEQLDTMRAALVEKQSQIRADAQVISGLEEQLSSSKTAMETYSMEYDMLYRETQQKAKALDRLNEANEAAAKLLHVRNKSIAEIEKRSVEIAKKESKVIKRSAAIGKEMTAADDARAEYEQKREALKSKIYYAQADQLRAEKKEAETLKRRSDGLKREKEFVDRKTRLAQGTTSSIASLISLNENAKKTIASDIAAAKQAANAQEAAAAKVRDEKEALVVQAEVAREGLRRAVEELRVQDAQAAELKKRIQEGHAKVKHQQTMYETVRTERNLHSRNLLNLKEEITTMKQKFKIMNYQIDLVRNEVTSKDHELVMEHFTHHAVQKDKQSLRSELGKIKKQILAAEQIVANQRTEALKLNQIIQEALEERQRQQKERDAVSSERQILNVQVVARNEELAKLYERHKLQRSTLRQGESAYRKLCAERDALAKELREGAEDRMNFGNDEIIERDLRQQVLSLEKALLQERTKIKALSVELDHPINVHRWQQLRFRNPEQWEMLRRVHKLHEQLIEKTQEITAREEAAKEKEQVYEDLKSALARQPSHLVSSQLSTYKGDLKDRVKQLKAMEHELGMYKQQVAEFQSDIILGESQLRDLKKAWIKSQQESLARSALPSTTAPVNPPPPAFMAQEPNPAAE
eukprot:scaffold1398_cov259-Pinguiococcus_pyrenoidosus.AAC.12